MKKLITSLLLLVTLLTFSAQTFALSAVSKVCSTSDANTSALCSNQNPSNPISGPHSLLHDVIFILSVVAGIIAVFMIVIGGLMYVLSGGDSRRVSEAKNILLYAVIGLVLVAIAEVILVFFLKNL